jgi:ABC-type branched-subunit amino acid transport system ATPase component/branched-subunit amino acid ABC-type transport system permease component
MPDWITELFKFALLGLGAGGLYALAAIGVVLVFRGSGIVNFSQAAMGMVGAYVFYEVHTRHDLPAFMGIAAGMAASAAIGALFHLLILRRMSGASDLAKIIASLAMLLVLTSGATLIYKNESRLVPSMLPTGPTKILGQSVGADRMWIFLIVVVLTTGLWAFYKLTTFGVATSAVAENPRAAAALAVSPNVVAAANWAVGGALGALAAILLVPITGLNAGNLTFLIIPVLAAAVIGGFRSFPITTIAGLSIGILQSWVTRYQDDDWVPGDWVGLGTAVPFILVAVVLLSRGRVVAGKDERFGRLPRLGAGRIAPVLIVLGVIVVELCAWVLFPDKWVDALIVQLMFAIVMMSFVVVTGLAGQLSLAQLSFAGVAALLASYLYDRQGWPFALVMLVGVLATIPIGVVLGLIGIRTRGVNLAIVTLGFAISVEAVVFGNSKYNGGTTSYQNDHPTFFGISIDSIDHPARYATFALALLVLIGLGVGNLRRSRVGRRLIAVRTNERAAASLGVSILGAKLYAFVLGAIVSGVAGVLLVFRFPTARFGEYSGISSILMMQNAVLGGVGTLNGPLVGSGSMPGSVGQKIFGFIPGDVALWIAFLSSLGLMVLLTYTPDGMSFLMKKQNDPWLTPLRERFSRKRPSVDLSLGHADTERVAPKTLTVNDVTVRFGGTVALSAFTAVVGPGEVIGLIGPNGAGKSTAIDAITGFLIPANGSVAIDGVPITSWTREQRARAGMTRSFQSLELFDDLTVLENIQAASDSRDLAGYVTTLFTPGKSDLTPAARRAVVDFGLEDKLHNAVSDLSYAERRMLAVARSVAGGQSIVLLDEPAAGLDDIQTRKLGDLIRKLALDRGIGFLLVEHNVDLVLRTCDKVYALNFGQTIGEGTPAEIRRNQAVVDAYLGTSHSDVEAGVTTE